MSSSRTWSLGYLLARYVDALAVSARASQAGKSFSEAVSAGVSAALAPRLTRVVFHAGTAMAPTLNGSSSSTAAAMTSVSQKKAAAAAASAATASASSPPPLPPVEGLLVRVLPSPDATSVRVGDVVAFTAPAVTPEEAAAVGAWPSEGQAQVLVRRVAASEGEELLVDEGEEDKEEKKLSSSPSSSYSVPRSHCWVLADNESLALPAARDSRSFGPLPYSSVLGRVVYAAASITDHRPIPRGGGGAGGGGLKGNGGSGGSFEEALLEAELDVGELAPPAPVA